MNPLPFTSHHPKFRVRGWTEILGRDETISAQDMVRHFMVNGETGSGKTASTVIPLLESILNYPEPDLYDSADKSESRDELVPSLLVIDPKRELAQHITREFFTVEYKASTRVLHMFEGFDLSTLDPYEAMDVILSQSNFFQQDQAKTKEPVWALQAASILRDMIAIEMWLSRHGTNLTDFWQSVKKGVSQDFKNSFTDSMVYNKGNYFVPHSALINSMASSDTTVPLAFYLDVAEKHKVPTPLVQRLGGLLSLASLTRSGVLWMTNGILDDLASEELAGCVCLNPIECPDNAFSVMDILNNGEIVVYKPQMSPIADLIGRCLKAKFFECAFKRENKVRPFFYVVDEAHRFLSSGESDAEHNLLDRCRAFRTGVILATQSVASMTKRIDYGSVQILLNNCGNAFYFRSSDPSTRDNLQSRIPLPPVPNHPHVLLIRPLTSLPVGSCYVLRSNGTWALAKISLA